MRPSLDPAYVARQIMAQTSARNAPAAAVPTQPGSGESSATQVHDEGEAATSSSTAAAVAVPTPSMRPPAPPPLHRLAQDQQSFQSRQPQQDAPTLPFSSRPLAPKPATPQQPDGRLSQESPGTSQPWHGSGHYPLPRLAAAPPSHDARQVGVDSVLSSSAVPQFPPNSDSENRAHHGQQHTGDPYSSQATGTVYPQSFATMSTYANSYNTPSANQQHSTPAMHSAVHYGAAMQHAQPENPGSSMAEAAQQYQTGLNCGEDQQDDGEDEDVDMLDDLGDDPLLARQNDLFTFEGSVRTFVGAGSEKSLVSEFGDKPVRQRKSVKRGPRKPAEPTGDVKLRLSAATNAFMSGDLDEALRQVNDAIRINGEIHRSWSLLAEVLRERGDYKQSLLALVCAAHLQPKIFDVWLDCGRFALELSEEVPEDADDTLRIAIMSLSQAVKIQPDNVGVRQLRAALYLTRESFKLAVSEYRWIVERSPHDVDALRGLADASVQLAESSRRQAEGQREIARDAYWACIQHFQSEYPIGSDNTQLTFTWDDAFAYVALLLHLEQFEDALQATRSLARWLLGRREDDYWDRLGDDREWDIGDERRLDVPEFDLEKFQPESYGRGLPLRLRISLAICRLRLDRHNDEEAMVCTSQPLRHAQIELTSTSNTLNSLILQMCRTQTKMNKIRDFSWRWPLTSMKRIGLRRLSPFTNPYGGKKISSMPLHCTEQENATSRLATRGRQRNVSRPLWTRRKHPWIPESTRALSWPRCMKLLGKIPRLCIFWRRPWALRGKETKGLRILPCSKTETVAGQGPEPPARLLRSRRVKRQPGKENQQALESAESLAPSPRPGFLAHDLCSLPLTKIAVWRKSEDRLTSQRSGELCARKGRTRKKARVRSGWMPQRSSLTTSAPTKASTRGTDTSCRWDCARMIPSPRRQILTS